MMTLVMCMAFYYALTADEGFSYTDLRDWAQRIRTQLTPIEGVQKVML